jgi:hypothetical protein
MIGEASTYPEQDACLQNRIASAATHRLTVPRSSSLTVMPPLALVWKTPSSAQSLVVWFSLTAAMEVPLASLTV